jgi:hypothetical protein
MSYRFDKMRLEKTIHGGIHHCRHQCMCSSHGVLDVVVECFAAVCKPGTNHFQERSFHASFVKDQATQDRWQFSFHEIGDGF